MAATPERRCVHCGDVIPEGEGVEAKALMVMGPDGKETWFTLSEGVVPESVVPSGPPWRLELPTHQGPGACARTRARLLPASVLTNTGRYTFDTADPRRRESHERCACLRRARDEHSSSLSATTVGVGSAAATQRGRSRRASTTRRCWYA